MNVRCPPLLWLIALCGACQASNQICISRDPNITSAACSTQVCFSNTAALTFTNDFAREATLVCNGCEQTHPVGYQLTATAKEWSETLPYDAVRMEQLQIELRENWNRKLDATSLNAALVQGRLFVSNIEEPVSGGAAMRLNTYYVGPGDIVSAKLQNGRTQIKLTGHLLGALATNRCRYLSPGTEMSEAPERSVNLDLPYEIYAPPPPPPPPLEVAVETSARAICRGECVTLNAVASGGRAPYTYSWDHGLPASVGPHRVCPTATTSYAVVSLDATPNNASSRAQRAGALASIAVRQNCAGTLPAPTPSAQCSVTLRSTNPDPLDAGGTLLSSAMALDAQGNIYLAGNARGLVDLGGDELGRVDSVWTSAIPSNAPPRSFLAKYDVNCKLLWSRRLNIDGDGAQIWRLLPAESGDVMALSSGTFKRDPFLDTAADSESSPLLVARLSGDGEVLNVTRLQPPLLGASTTLDPAGNLLIVGAVSNGTDLGTGPVLFASGYGDVALKLAPGGETLQVTALDGSLNGALLGLGADGSLHLQGSAYPSLRIGASGPELRGDDEFSAFDYAARVDASGAPLFQVALPSADALGDLWTGGIDAAGNTLLMTDWPDDFSIPTESTLSMRKLTPNGSLAWERRSIRSDGQIRALSALHVSADGSFMLASDNYPADAPLDRGNAVNTPTLTKYDADGQVVWERALAPRTVQGIAQVESYGPGQVVLLVQATRYGFANTMTLIRMPVP